MTATSPSPRPGSLLWTVALASAACLGFEISLMRMLLVASWHHFAFMVISVALLGFGTAGTALAVFRERLIQRTNTALFVLTVAAAMAIPLCSSFAQHVPVEAALVPGSASRQVACWLVYWAIWFVPFLLSASVICLALMSARDQVAVVYASNLVGSGIGAVGATVLMNLLPPAWLPTAWGIVAMAGAAGAPGGSKTIRLTTITLCCLCAAAWLHQHHPTIRIDPYKQAAYVERLEQQGAARHIAHDHSPRSVIDVYRSELFHDMPFLSFGAVPPPMDALLIDGHHAGSILRITGPNQAEAVDNTLMAVSYELVPPFPRVLLLGETGGANVWLAIRQGAQITVVQPDGKLVGLLRGPLHNTGGAVLARPEVEVAIETPRHFVERSRDQYHLIYLSALETSAAGSGGMGGLGQDDLVTVEGITACLRRLSPDGVLVACRAIQTPPRDNVKLLATIVAALREMNVANPAPHVVILRDFLGLCTVVRRQPCTTAQVEDVRRICRQRQLTPVWFDGIRPDELNQPDHLPGPPDDPGDWYHYAARQLFSPSSQQFIDNYAYDTRPPTDDRPFFLDFCRLSSLDTFRSAYGDLWLTRAELAFLFVLAAIGAVTVVGVVLTLLPLATLRGDGHVARRTATAAYFTAIGLGYLLLEMAALTRLTLIIGDPITAAAVTISSFLVLSGVGSLIAQWACRQHPGSLPAILLGVVLAATAVLMALNIRIPCLLTAGAMGRGSIAVLLMAPLAVLMGFPMPAALARLDRAAPRLLPWAWGVNGFASVLAAPLATAMGMAWGFRCVGGAAVLMYLLAAILFGRLPGNPSANNRA